MLQHARPVLHTLAAAAAVGALSCRGGEIPIGGYCPSDSVPPADALEPTVFAKGARSWVLPSGRRIRIPDNALPGDVKLGFPIDVVAHPTEPVLYVADTLYGASTNSVRCPEEVLESDSGTAAEAGDGAVSSDSEAGMGGPDLGIGRGIHVVRVDADSGPKQLQFTGDTMHALPPGFHPSSPAEARATMCAEKFIPRDGAFGLAMSRKGRFLYASTGISGFVLRFEVDPDGLLRKEPRPIFVGGFTAGIALSPPRPGNPNDPGETRIFVVRFLGGKGALSSWVVEVKVAPEAGDSDGGFTESIVSETKLSDSFGAYDIAASADPTQDGALRLWITGFRDGRLHRLRRTDSEPFKEELALDVGKNPEQLAVLSDGRALVTVSDADELVIVPPLSDGSDLVRVATGSYLKTDDTLLGASPSGLAVSEDESHVFVVNSGDDSVAMIDLTRNPPVLKGALPTGAYPTGVARVSHGDAGVWLAVTHGRTSYSDAYERDSAQNAALCCASLTWYPCATPGHPYMSDAPVCEPGRIGEPTCIDGTTTRRDVEAYINYNPAEMQGSLVVLPLASDPEPAFREGGAEVAAAIQHPVGSYPSPCVGRLFPIPAPGDLQGMTPIKHIVLVVRENKTYDALLGDLEQDNSRPNGACGLSIDAIRRSLGLPPITQNIHALARRFTSLDNFYADAEVSMQGHAWLTSSLVNDYLERIHQEEYSSDFFGFAFDQEIAFSASTPGSGSFFEHLIRHGVSFKIFGEATGVLGHVGDSYVAEHMDLRVPLNDRKMPDVQKVQFVTDALLSGDAPAFTYVLLPRDHTDGLDPGQASPVSMIAENDLATGLLVERLSSNADFWMSSAVFIVEDDSQQGRDHVDYHRTICVIASPWAKRSYTSSVHASFPALFHTFEQILGIKPMNRYDAFAPVLWDAFSSTPTCVPKTDDCVFHHQGPAVPLDAVNPACTGIKSRRPVHERPLDADQQLGSEIWEAITTGR